MKIEDKASEIWEALQLLDDKNKEMSEHDKFVWAKELLIETMGYLHGLAEGLEIREKD